MESEKQHIKHCILFSFQLKKNATEVATDLISFGGRCCDV